MTRPLIYHIFADTGVESEALSSYGRVVRIGLNPIDTNESEVVKADATKLPLQKRADLVVLHPPCQKWSPATNVYGDQGEWPDLIDLSRDIGREYGAHYILENVPAAPLEDPVVLDGRMFGLPIGYRRAFETSFYVEQPPRFSQSLDNHNLDGGWGGTMDFWRTLKGYSGEYPSKVFKRAGIPRAYIDYLIRHWLRATGRAGKKQNMQLEVVQ